MLLSGALGLTTIASLAVPPAASAPAATDDRYGHVWNILPPGESGTITALDLAKVLAGGSTTAVDGRNAPKNFANQLEMYDGIARRAPGSLTRADLDTYYKRAEFTPRTVTREIRPKEGVTIRWDEWGVPYVNGTTFGNVAFGAGYSQVRDRMFLMDVLRHAGKARLAEFAGATESNLALDATQLQNGYYTEAEAFAQLEGLRRRYGAEGNRLADAALAYVAGINAAQEDMCPAGLPTGPACPAEYAALQKRPEPWTAADVVYVASLVGGIFGKGGGTEYRNAVWLQRLTARFGRTRALGLYRDLRHKQDPDTPTTIATRTPWGGSDAVQPGLAGVALPDLGSRTAPGTGALIQSDGSLLAAASGLLSEPTSLKLDLPGGSFDFPIRSRGMSNAIVVAGRHTTTGRPMAVFGPQTDYFVPQLWAEQVLVGPGIKTRGVSFAGTGVVNQIGRGVDYAWSATSSLSDNVDTVAERLCNLDGSAPTVSSVAYVDGGTCRPMDRRVHSYTALPSATSQKLPKTYRYLVLRTRHGIVQERTTVRGRPVAMVSQRSTYQREGDSLVGFARMNDPAFVRNGQSFLRAAARIEFSFNWHYLDDRDIAYYSSGRLPLRSAETDFDLPRWPGSRYGWQGFLSDDRHPQVVNPASGVLANWNNKPAPGFAAADSYWGAGIVHRNLAITDRFRAATRDGRNLTLQGVVGLMQSAAVADTRAVTTLPLLLRVIGDQPGSRRARQLLSAWLAAGAPRVDRDRDGHYSHEQAIAIFDTWWERGVAQQVLAGRLGATLSRQLPTPLDNHPRDGLGSAWNDSAFYSYVNKDLKRLLGIGVRAPYANTYCGAGSLSTCRSMLRTSLVNAVNQVLAEQGVASVDALTYDKSKDQIASTPAGAVGVRPIEWQNRPTFQQVVEFFAHRPR